MKKILIFIFFWFLLFFCNISFTKADIVFTDVILTWNSTWISPYQNLNNNTWSLGYSWSTNKIAQSFIPKRQRINSIIIKPSSSIWAITWDINIWVYVDSGWTVWVNNICTNIITKSMWDSSINQELSIDCQWFFSNMDWTKYWLVLQTNILWDASNYYRVSYYWSDVYNGGKFIRYNGSTWSDVGTTDMYFWIKSDFDYLNIINYDTLRDTMVQAIFYWFIMCLWIFIVSFFIFTIFRNLFK